ncbi:MAG TPA: DUF2157 domain-containing protein [Terriglobales bacterium]|nr:DUF2157 domain-containing protein [Terriglobales bacterium]
MSQGWESTLQRWTKAGLIDAITAERIRQFEASQEKPGQLQWPVLLAVALGALMLGAGVLLFVSAHWDNLSPSGRFSLVLLLVAIFHVSGAILSTRFSALSTALHAVGTIALGAGIFLAAQIFNLQEHWPGGVLLWSVGAALAWFLLKEWPQAAAVALLLPAWLGSEWIDATQRFRGIEPVLARGIFLLAITYLTAFYGERRGAERRALAWIGALALIPSAVVTVTPGGWMFMKSDLPAGLLAVGTILGLLLPLVLAWWLRGRAAWLNGIAAMWVLLAMTLTTYTPQQESLIHYAWREVGPYIWCGLAALGLIAWGLLEARRERINLGVAGFGLTVIVFYFSEVMDKLGRSASLIGFGILFLVLGWLLEKTRRQLVAKVRAAAA